MALKAKALRTIDDLTPKQRKFVDIMKLRMIRIFRILEVD
jgi:hypothetical protein